LNRKGRPRIDPAAVKKILLIRLRRIGDVVMTTPSCLALKASIPHASLSYVVEEPYVDLMENNPCVDETIPVPRPLGKRDFLRLARNLRGQEYDVVIDFHGGPTASLLAFLSRAGLVIGYRVPYRRFLYDITVPRRLPQGHIHSVENHLNLVRALGITAPSSFPLSLPQAEEEEAARIGKLLARGGAETARAVVLHVGAGNAFRDWGVKNLLSLLSLLGERSDTRVFLVGAEEEAATARLLLEKGPPSLTSLVGMLNLRELRELIARADLFVGPDSGPMHIAASTATPIVALFGPTIPAHFSPWRKRDVLLLEEMMECRPCRQKSCLTKDFRCLRTLRPEKVYEACARFLDRKGFPAS